MVIGCVVILIISLTSIISNTVNSMHRRRVEEELKQDMLDRGMSADDITKIIEAAPQPENAAERWVASWCKKK